ncbi:HD-GYP domain-containing protein [Oceanobacillus bengalensis]|uniref:HD-GYP domain-containing protein n=1 Tax=Oceanobacillus bengalensis TaxID=1435466 RepID=A0A494YYH0_9BACI|nr:HD-GYP domain-containing protein [Oceanobacillus bengalensis]RKQ15242.1 HD-GYP domain-containing protein [Oceanobacillus bengalensis]
MRVKPSQLVPGNVLLKEVLGKSNKPIITRKTVLDDIHIEFLERFLIESVDVSAHLSNGDTYEPKKVDAKKEQLKKIKAAERKQTFEEQFYQVVKGYKQLFSTWKSGIPIDMANLRKLIIPLLERTDDIDKAVYTLHQYTTKNDYIYCHSIAVSILSSYLGRKLGYEKGEWLQIGIAGLLSDVGMAKINSEIVYKTGPLASYELNEVRKHPTYSYRLIENIPTITQAVKLAVLQHHERIDGSGYPLGITMKKIHPYARIIGISDTYHAMTSERVYKKGLSPFKVIEEMKKVQFTKFDSQIVSKFISSLTNFSIGTKVKLSNGKTGEIVFIEPSELTRPIVRMDGSGEIIALQNEQDVYINELILK